MNELKRELRLFSTTSIVIANMIGAGIFTTSGLLMRDLQHPFLMIFLWIAGALIALCGALCYGELGAAMPDAGGEYIFLSRLFHPSLGFLSGWISFFVGFSAPIAASALGVGEYMTRAFPGLVGSGNPQLTVKIIAVLVILAFSIVHLRGINFSAIVQNYLTIIKVALVAVLVFAGFAFGRGDFGHFSQGEVFTFNFAGWKTVGLSLMWIMFAYSGWNASAYIGSEIKNPERNLPLSLIIGTGIVAVLYFALNALYIYAVPPEEMKGVISIVGLAAGNLFGGYIESLISILIAFALFSSISAFIILGPRVYYAMARDGYFFKIASQVHPVFGVPSKSIILQCLIALILVMSGTFDQILVYMGFSLGIFPIFAVVSVFKLRKIRGDAFTMPLFPLVPLIFIVAQLMILTLSYFERPVESSIAVATVLVGIPVFFIFRRIYEQSPSQALDSVMTHPQSTSRNRSSKKP